MFTEFLQIFCKYLMDIPAEEYIATGRKIYRDRQKNISRPEKCIGSGIILRTDIIYHYLCRFRQ